MTMTMLMKAERAVHGDRQIGHKLHPNPKQKKKGNKKTRERKKKRNIRERQTSRSTIPTYRDSMRVCTSVTQQQRSNPFFLSSYIVDTTSQSRKTKNLQGIYTNDSIKRPYSTRFYQCTVSVGKMAAALYVIAKTQQVITYKQG